MKNITKKQLKEILENHRLWLNEEGGERANLVNANLINADLGYANLGYANLEGANLENANLVNANLRYANLRNANLGYANLRKANLINAYLINANLENANLENANLRGANLGYANLENAKLPSFQIPQEGELIVYKKLRGGTVCKLKIPKEAKRTASLVGRKCRAEFAEVLQGEGVSRHDGVTEYKVGNIVKPNGYNDDIRVECAEGIHFFLTKEEAERY